METMPAESHRIVAADSPGGALSEDVALPGTHEVPAEADDIDPDEKIDEGSHESGEEDSGDHQERRRRWSVVKRILAVVASVVFVVAFLGVFLIAVTTKVAPDGEATALGHPVFIVLSGSMSPAVNTGDLIIDDAVTPTQAKHLRVGEVVSFREAPGSSMIFNHRIVKVISEGGAVLYETKGDANDAPDGALRPSSDIIGVDAWRIPRGGYFLHNLHDPVVFLLLILAPLLWCVGLPLRRYARRLDA
jgi:signal peptidase